MIKFAIGIVIGITSGVGFLAFGPQGFEVKIRKAGDEAELVRYEQCQRKVLEETACHRKLTPRQCSDIIHYECGPANN